MECPDCGAELLWVDYYGLGPKCEPKLGDIYKCQNEECPSEDQAVPFHFYTDKSGDLHAGYPC